MSISVLAEQSLKEPSVHLPVFLFGTHFIGGTKMDAIRTYVAGVDVHKEVLAISVLRGDADAESEVIILTRGAR